MDIEKRDRMTWDEYFMEIAKSVAYRATCDRGRSGAVIVKDKKLLATGYVGSPVGLPHCDEVGHLTKEVKHDDGRITKHCLRTTHAEMNAIVQAAKHGTPIDGSTLYCKMEPCLTCAKAIINSGIKRVVALHEYHDGDDTRKFLSQAGVHLKVMEPGVEEYVGQ
jgi:dCMP deaminase